ncbi:cobalt ABC transporter substrate-binding protein [Arsukibacterium ikkense]|uniref:Cobalt ABC transporter substrate-binding protein n=1 Tax=Arsukibacterium ikkense TaxID=336831 RepID=A0A0M2V0P3_9GAMM|nr:DUF4198 domain-containing protein [Arsukibacterium ikkense]KKO44136.1 cobalt ABC transporter substrate-binding protein [Arsukibacterium ikkense]
MKVRLSLAAAVFSVLAAPASSHTLYILPSHFVISTDSSWITADISAANMTFQPDKGVSVANFRLHLPDGSVQQAAGSHQGKRKAMVDVELSAEGTYRLELGGPARYFTSYQLNGERKRLQADKTERAASLPAGAENIQTTQSRSKAISYITLKQPTTTVITPRGEGLELVTSLHPADIVAGEPLAITLLLDGKAQAGVALELSFDGENYRDDAMRVLAATDNHGQFTYTPASAGRYLLEARYNADVATTRADRISEGLTWSFEVALP